MYCAVCGRDDSAEWFELRTEDADPEPPQTWVLCKTCRQAVGRELARAQLRTPARVRVAIGIVGSEWAASAAPRTVATRRADSVERLLLATVFAAFLIHALAFVAIVTFIAARH